MTDSETREEKQEHLRDLLEDFDNGMLVTRGEDEEIYSCPMSIAHYDEHSDELTFVTAIGSKKVEQIRLHPKVNVSFQSKTKYVSVSGRARVYRDVERVRELWSPEWKIWFPDGPEDASIALLTVEFSRGEYWDMSGSKGLKYMWAAGKALLRGEEMSSEPAGTHDVVSS